METRFTARRRMAIVLAVGGDHGAGIATGPIAGGWLLERFLVG